MSIRVGLRAMGRALGVVVPVVPPPVFPMEYICAYGAARPYSVRYDDLEGTGPFTVATDTEITATVYTFQRDLARMSDRKLYAVYLKKVGTVDQIFVKESADEGETWENETQLSTYAGMDVNAQSAPAIAVDGDDNLHVVWFGRATGYTIYQIWYVKFDGASWSAPVRDLCSLPGMDTKHQYTHSIAVDSADNVHVVWAGITTAIATFQIYHNVYTTEWGTPVRISDGVNMATKHHRYACIAVDGDDNLHVVWGGNNTAHPTYRQVFHNKYTTSWAGPVRISTYTAMEDYSQLPGCIAFDSDDNILVVWEGKAFGFTSQNQVWYAKYTDSWANPVRISTYANMSSYRQTYSTIAVDPDDVIHVLWQGKATGYTTYDVVWHAEYTDSWAAPVCLQPTGRWSGPNLRWSRWP